MPSLRKFPTKIGLEVLESIKISGLGGSVVCDRIVKLVLGDVGLEFEENGGKRKNGEGERFERGTGQQI